MAPGAGAVVKKKEQLPEGEAPAPKKKRTTTAVKKDGVNGVAAVVKGEDEDVKKPAAVTKKGKVSLKKGTKRKGKASTPSITSTDDDGSEGSDFRDAVKVDSNVPRRTSGRARTAN